MEQEIVYEKLPADIAERCAARAALLSPLLTRQLACGCRWVALMLCLSRSKTVPHAAAGMC